jgi:hypothetical protein
MVSSASMTKTQTLIVTFCAFGLLGCSKEKPAEGKGGIVFVHEGGPVILDVTDLTLRQKDNNLFLKFKLTGTDGEGECDFEGYQLEGEFGPYQINAGRCEIKAGGAAFSASPGTAQGSYQASYQESTISFTLKGTILQEAKRGPPYVLTFEGTH